MDNAVPRVQLKRVNPFMGLMIDAGTWRDSHDYHRVAGQAHALAMHGWGIVTGLEVDAADPADRSVWIRPGVAVDPEGRLIIVAQPFRYQITSQEAGQSYLVLMFREIPTENVISIEDGAEQPSRILEAYAIYERDRLPDQAHVELARIQQSAGKKAIKDAADPVYPKQDEIDTRYREQAAIRPGLRTTLGIWKPADVGSSLVQHLPGPKHLFDELSASVDWRLRRRDQPQGTGDEPLDCDLLLMPVSPNTSFSDPEKKQLKAFLDGGGVMLVEGCAAGGGDVQKVFALLAQAVSRKPQPVQRQHPLLTARHIFAVPPPGAAAGQLIEADGLLLSTADYTCAWNGGTPDKAMSRGDIRTAVEFAENMLAYSLVRRGNAQRAQRSDRRG